MNKFEGGICRNGVMIPSNLEPCPFCGSKAKVVHGSFFLTAKTHVECTKCGAKTREFNSCFASDYAEMSAKVAWNVRTGEHHD